MPLPEKLPFRRWWEYIAGGILNMGGHNLSNVGNFDANTILKADSNNTPVALTIAEQRIVGRITAGVITALTAAQVNTLLATFLADGSVEMTGAFTQQPLSADPGDPDAGNWTFWISDGTDTGNAGDLWVKVNVNGTVKTWCLGQYNAH